VPTGTFAALDRDLVPQRTRLPGCASCGGGCEDLGEQAVELLLFAVAEGGEWRTRVGAGE
jgi:hypothetical protein